ncbi:hypothetical protein CBS101457_003463 [Exobasidium rhododendri]|nr:hypothetical protein CBS101457_003463 [Exobasidium rhododendri]
MSGSGGAGLNIAWRRGTASMVQRLGSVDMEGEREDFDDEEDSASIEGEESSSPEDDDDAWLSSSSAGPLTRRYSRRRSRNRSGSWCSKGLQTRTTSGSSSQTGSDASGGVHLRRFSSHGSEAAFLRHETVIGIHTPHRESLSERMNLAPLSQIQAPTVESVGQISPNSSMYKKKQMKASSSAEVLAQAAAAAAAAANKPSRRGKSSLPSSFSFSDDEDAGTSIAGIVYTQKARSASPRVAFKLSKRRKPIKVEGTLYDRTGPFREGVVTDGLSVRLFSAEDASEDVDYHHDGGLVVHDQAVDDEEMVPATYLITTPDNRVSSAAKLRRWAMDGEGRFYAAMEIKSIEAKMRAADPLLNGAGQGSKTALKELRDRYVDDLLDEVQKTETLNPDRIAVDKVLRTSDNKYVRLEEDYPEEAFFVIAGCDEDELYPTIALVFCQALRAIVRFHSAGWLHGDIKLENLMFDEKGKMVVIDYENANPFRGIPRGDGKVTLASYDWIPPEAFPGPHGRRVGPSADLWALGCNIVRAFALRDHIEDNDIRETLLGKGQAAFFVFRKTHLLRKRPNRRSSTEMGIPGTPNRPLPTSDDVDLSCLLVDDQDHEHVDDQHADLDVEETAEGRVGHGSPPPPGPSPKRLLSKFARDAPQLLKLVIARCITELPEERSVEAEVDCIKFVDALEEEQRKLGEKSMLGIGNRAVMTAIDLSGSAWVRPKLEDARKSLGLGE